MDDIEPWNMFTNDYMPDDATDGDVDGNGNGNGGDDSSSIPASVQEMQVKEEPQDHVEENFDDATEMDDASFGFHSIAHGEISQNNNDDGGGEGDDNALFDFSEVGGSSSFQSRASESPHNPVSSKPNHSTIINEGEYKSNALRYEDAIIYICPACGEEFHSQESWKLHLNAVHQFGNRRGLNFIQLDKLYHECLECHKRIAMHSMENLLKHKFTHLPYRCVKCDVCKRQYKYRQDLMIHLRMAHRDELMALFKKNQKNKEQQISVRNITIRSILSKPVINASNSSSPQIAIGQIKENATDIFDRSDNIEVRNELLNDEDDDDCLLVAQPPPAKKTAPEYPSFFDDGSTSGSANDNLMTALTGASRSKVINDIDDSLEEYILFLCPQCGSECETQAQWRQHIEFIHGYGTRKGLNMRDINQGQAQCKECNQIITNNKLQNLQMHKFNHLPRKQWMNCKLCFTSFNDPQELTKHLSDQHHLEPEPNGINDNTNNDDDSQEPFGFGNDDFDDDPRQGSSTGGEPLNEQDLTAVRRDERNEFEEHIIYLCPQCGKEFNFKKIWRKHIVEVHNLGDIENMNFEVLNERQLRCRECDKIITNAYGIQNAQQHRITHMQYKSFAKCRLCLKKYTDRKGLVKHLRGHGVGTKNSNNRHCNNSSPIPNFGSNSVSSFKSYGSNNKIKPYRTATFPQREIVRHNNYTFEICFLDEDADNSGGGSRDVGSRDVGSRDVGRGSFSFNRTSAPYDFAKGDAHLYRNSYSMPKHTPNSYPIPKQVPNLEIMARHRCVDCGSSFRSAQVLQHHIKTEHEFIDFGKTSSKKSSHLQEDRSNDVDDLLVASRVVDARTESRALSNECHFIYICPQCGIEFRERHLWRRHINDEHNFDKRDSLNFRTLDKFRFQCKTCHETVQSSKLKGLQDHKFRHCPYRQYLRCLICGQAYNHKPNMITHLRQRHNITFVEPSNIPSNRDVTSKLLAQTAGKSFNEMAAGTSRLVKANDSNQAASNASRPSGLKTVEDVISFHNAVDHESITYHCPSCNDSFESHVYWRKHIVEEHNLNSREGLHFRQLDDHHYICLQCYKRVTVTHTKGAIGQLQSHKFRHLPYKSFGCTVCCGEFVRKQMFFKHLDKKTNKCPGPPQEFADPDESQAKINDSQADNDITVSAPVPAQSSSEKTADNSSSENQGCFTLSCPQCGVNFETTRGWREHINIEHSLNNRTVLNFKKLNPKLHVCLECDELVNGRKLRDLQVHKFKHLPYGSYLHCRFCSMNYHHISNMQEHLKNKHPSMLQKMKNFDDAANFDEEEEDEEDSRGIATGDYAEDDNNGGADSADASTPEVDIDQLEAEAEIEEVDPDNVESDEQYLLG